MHWWYVQQCEEQRTAFLDNVAEWFSQLLDLDSIVAYQHAFAYVRDLAVETHIALSLAEKV